MKSVEIRKRFFDFFTRHGHERVASSPLIPAQDPTLLFANAGMNQFKDVFLGTETRSYRRAVTIQKCVRAGGKHNDLDTVGFTKRHLTFFEMMGNFSFGDYFKKEAIEYAWNFLTKEIGLPADVLHASVFLSDEESYALWRDHIGLPETRIHRLGAADNFWQMGETGPCGPCTEIYVDRSELYGKGTFAQNQSGERFLEVWNLVFMQYDRQIDGTDRPLVRTGVDTGMGLERLALVMQKVDSVFQTDLFTPLIAATEKLTDISYADQSGERKAAFHVLADHVRCASLIIADGAIPSNEGRGYVLRKIIRRAALFSQKLDDPFILPQLSKAFVEQMGTIYPELFTQQKHIFDVLYAEVQKFSTNLVRGQTLLSDYFASAQTAVVIGEQAFKLYDTFGFPLELIRVMAHERNFSVDEDGFNLLMQRQKMASGQKTQTEVIPLGLDPQIRSEFTGYSELTTASRISALVVDDAAVSQVSSGTDCWVIAAASPFFIVGGGQVPDQGTITVGKTTGAVMQVKHIGHAIAALIQAPVAMRVGDEIVSTVDKQWRTNAMKNHTATHLLQAALMSVLGSHIKQSGSLVHPDYLRFDFLHHDALSPEQLAAVEDLVNEKIRENIPVITEYTTLADAQKRGVIAFFGDKYNPEQVRIVQIADFSAELCGGTHVRATGDIGVFKITESSALAAGYRRIVALTGPRACQLFQYTFDVVKGLSTQFKIKKEAVLDAVTQLMTHARQVEAELQACKEKLVEAEIPGLLSRVEIVKGCAYLFVTINKMSVQELRTIALLLVQKQPGLYVLVSSADDGFLLLVALSQELSGRISLQALGQDLKEQFGVRGGGNKTLFQGSMATASPNLEKTIKEWLFEKL